MQCDTISRKHTLIHPVSQTKMSTVRNQTLITLWRAIINCIVDMTW